MRIVVIMACVHLHFHFSSPLLPPRTGGMSCPGVCSPAFALPTRWIRSSRMVLADFAGSLFLRPSCSPCSRVGAAIPSVLFRPRLAGAERKASLVLISVLVGHCMVQQSTAT